MSKQGQGSGYLVYLDNILFYSKTEKELLQMLCKAFEHLLKAGLKIKLSKSSFFKGQIHYLRHIVSGMSILPPAKIKAIMKSKTPTSIKEVRNCLRLSGYYWKFICNYADISHPLNCLMCKSQPFIWIPHCQSSFDMLHSCPC